MTKGLCARNITVRYGQRTILGGVNAEIAPGTVTAVVGPNGAGKSTLLKVLSGDIAPQSGEVLLNGRPLQDWTAEECALQRAVLPQSPELAFSFRVWDVVALGRHPHRNRGSAEEDREAVRGAMEAADVAGFAGRDCGTLSGGEVHLTHYARTLAQIWAPLPGSRARYLLLDEPTSSLDLFHQHAIMAKACTMARAGAGVLAVLHDLNLAAAYANTLIVVTKGGIEATGRPTSVLTKERISRIWHVDCDVSVGAHGKVQVLVNPIGAHQAPLRAVPNTASLQDETLLSAQG